MTEPADQGEGKSQSTSWLRREWRLLVGLALSALCLFLAVRKISWLALKEALSTAQWEWAALAMVVMVTSTSLKALRWRALFLPKRLPFGKVWSVYMIGQLLNAVLPARAGEVGRVYLMGEDSEVGYGTALSTVVVEKVVDLVMLTLFYLLVALWLTTTPSGLPQWMQDAGRVLIPLTLLAIAGLLLLTRYGRPIWRFLRKGFGGLRPHWQDALNRAAEQAIAALDAFRHGPARTQVWGWSILIWALMAWTNALVFKAFDLSLSPVVAVLLLVVLMSVVSVPPLPGNVGVLVYLCVLVLSLFGVNRETALLYGVSLQGVVYLPVMVLGLICMLWTNWSPKRSSPASHHVP